MRAPPGSITRERFERLQKLAPLLAQGGYTIVELATRFGVHVSQISQDKRYIIDKWWRQENQAATAEQRLIRIKELEQIKRLALESYHRSRQDIEEITSRFEKKKCEECGGLKYTKPGVKCFECEGIGYVEEEIVNKKVKGSPGDATFLNVAKNCVVELIKLEGLQIAAEVKVQHVVDGKVEHLHSLEERYKDVDPNLIIEAKAVMARLEEAAKRPKLTEMVEETRDGE